VFFDYDGELLMQTLPTLVTLYCETYSAAKWNTL